MKDTNGYYVGQIVKIVKIEPLEGKKIAPPLKIDEEREIKEIVLDNAGNQHLDLGLVSEYNYITSFETGEELERGDKIHWVHPSRVKLI